MADIKKINFDGTEYNIKDEVIRNLIGDNNTLNTTDKSSIVNAINEVNGKANSDILLVTSDLDTMTASHSMSEIKSAQDAGKAIFLVNAGGCMIFNNITDSGALFNLVYTTDDKLIGVMWATIDENKNISLNYDSDYIPSITESDHGKVLSATADGPAWVEQTGDSGPSVQADYNQNDSTANDYIKNRPFYKEIETELFNGDITFDSNSMADTDVVLLENEGDILEITIGENATEIIEVSNFTFNGTTSLIAGNKYIYYEFGVDAFGSEDALLAQIPEIAAFNEDTGESYIILNNTNSEGVTNGSSVMIRNAEDITCNMTINKVIIHKLDTMFINWEGGGAPSSLPTVTSLDNDKVLMVVDGKWAAGSITDGDEVAY